MIDKIYCINLYERTDRMITSKAIFDAYELPVEYHRVQRDTTSGQRGCFNSHIEIINKARSENLNNVLIFEDDIICNLSKHEFDDRMQLVYNFIKNYDYDIFFLGSSPKICFGCPTKITDNIYKTNAYLAHAYILSKSGIAKYHNLKYTGNQIDHIYSNSDKSYAIYPSIFYQSLAESDVNHSWFDKPEIRDLFGKLNENYATRISIPIILLIALLIIILMLIYVKTKRTIFLILTIILMIIILTMYYHRQNKSHVHI